MPKRECEACRFFESDMVESGDGLCRRYPPVLLRTESDECASAFPAVSADDWCGEWQPVTVGVRKAGPRQRRITGE